MNRPESLEEVLEGYAVETPKGNDPEVLQEWIREYPEFADELMDFAATRSRIDHMPDPVLSPEDEGAARSRGAAAMKSVLGELADRESSRISDLIKTAEEKGLDRTVLAMKLDMSVTFLLKLNRRAIKAASIPQGLVEKISTELGVAAESVRTYFELPQRAAGSEFKASDRPESPDQEDFAKAVELDLHLSPGQKDSLLKLQKT
ncbi:MAG: hypothetical protein DWQ47_11440 [Acidobacteria bacterium]|nr:MAG: hypothetical protein DWQ32_13855 [Acidobacteriota bacterium]REJ98189.1 MAG: hypothetical protein DWQ38_16655 [Acidobacteriota bacterium]REK16933.1 MAG: hypothetical protein DWQ43_01700 [Acidobacteriota bacterium]REK42843.1 MAG: hypothetical protein DWQ47_11440 [Acidobacteriota bacterium]